MWVADFGCSTSRPRESGDPYRVVPSIKTEWLIPSAKLTPVAMGPCVRRDDRSHRRAKHPGREFGAAEIKALALGRLSRSRLQHQLENALAALLHRFLAVED